MCNCSKNQKVTMDTLLQLLVRRDMYLEDLHFRQTNTLTPGVVKTLTSDVLSLVTPAHTHITCT